MSFCPQSVCLLDIISDALKTLPLSIADIKMNLIYKNLKPVVFENYYEAQLFQTSIKRKVNEWSIVITTPDTSGEKLFEEFVGIGEKLSPVTNLTSQIVPVKSALEQLRKIREYVSQELIYNQANNIDTVRDLICEAIPSFKHSQSQESLDGRP
jgi:hypothetical protein